MTTEPDKHKSRPLRNLAHGIVDPVDRFREEMERMFNTYWRLPGGGMLPSEAGPLVADLDISETPEAVQVVLDVPGMKQSDIEVTVNDSTLTVKGKRESEKEEKKKNYHRVERHFGEFQRRVTLPCEVDAEHVQATLKDGVLSIDLMKSARALQSERKIAIKSA